MHRKHFCPHKVVRPPALLFSIPWGWQLWLNKHDFFTFKNYAYSLIANLALSKFLNDRMWLVYSGHMHNFGEIADFLVIGLWSTLLVKKIDLCCNSEARLIYFTWCFMNKDFFFYKYITCTSLKNIYEKIVLPKLVCCRNSCLG